MENKTPYTPEHFEKNIRRTIPHYSDLQKEVIELIKSIRPDCKMWLDTGCGTGTLIEKAIREFPDCRFRLNDPSKDMIEYTKKRVGSCPEQICEFSCFTTSGLPETETEKYDVITAMLSHHYLSREERKITTAKCYDMLKTGGVYITFEHTAPNSEKGIEIVMDRWKRFQLSCGKEEQAVEEHLQRFNTAYFPITIKEHLELLKETRFSTCELFWASGMQAGFYAIK